MAELTPEALYDAYRDKVLAYLTSRTDSREDADDLCHDVFEQVFRSMARYDPSRSSVSTWIYQITRFTLIDYIRTKHPGEKLTGDIPNVLEKLGGVETLSLLQSLAQKRQYQMLEEKSGSGRLGLFGRKKRNA